MHYPEIKEYLDSKSGDTFLRMYVSLYSERFKISDLGVPARVITHWKKEGLLPFLKEGKWTRINLMEYFWIRIVSDLRSLGLSIARIRTVYQEAFTAFPIDYSAFFDAKGNIRSEHAELFKEVLSRADHLTEIQKNIDTGDPEFLEELKAYEFPLFYYLVIQCVTYNWNFFMLVPKEGESIIVLDHDDPELEEAYGHTSLSEFIAELDYQPMAIISFRRYLLDIVLDKKLQSKVLDISPLDKVEWEVINTMREGNLKELKIIFDPKEAKKDIVKTYSGVSSAKEIEKVMAQFYQKKHVKLTMKSSNGKTVQYEYQRRTRLT
jgi:DNA-binding transcriptional MerR regulator